MYGIIIGAFVLAGLAMSFWGGWLLARARKRKTWPHTEGVIEKSFVAKGDLYPDIVFCYTVAQKSYRTEFEYPAGAGASPELAEQTVRQFPQGATIPVYYDPAAPQSATLLPAGGRDNWLILVIGVFSTLFGLGLLAFHG